MNKYTMCVEKYTGLIMLSLELSIIPTRLCRVQYDCYNKHTFLPNTTFVDCSVLQTDLCAGRFESLYITDIYT